MLDLVKKPVEADEGWFAWYGSEFCSRQGGIGLVRLCWTPHTGLDQAEGYES